MLLIPQVHTHTHTHDTNVRQAYLYSTLTCRPSVHAMFLQCSMKLWSKHLRCSIYSVRVGSCGHEPFNILQILENLHDCNTIWKWYKKLHVSQAFFLQLQAFKSDEPKILKRSGAFDVRYILLYSWNRNSIFLKIIMPVPPPRQHICCWSWQPPAKLPDLTLMVSTKQRHRCTAEQQAGSTTPRTDGRLLKNLCWKKLSLKMAYRQYSTIPLSYTTCTLALFFRRLG